MAAPIGAFLSLVDEVYSIPGLRHVKDESLTTLFAVGEDVQPQYLLLAALLIALALGVWYTAIRTPPALP